MAKETWLRVVIYDSDDPEAAEKYMAHTAQDVVRVLEKTPGCTLGYWGQDPEHGTMAAVTYWNSLEAIEAAQPALQQFQEEREKLGIRVQSATNFMLKRVSPFSS